jgi:CO/xanthine dehydrogenase FAD-binding subunit
MIRDEDPVHAVVERACCIVAGGGPVQHELALRGLAQRRTRMLVLEKALVRHQRQFAVYAARRMASMRPNDVGWGDED